MFIKLKIEGTGTQLAIKESLLKLADEVASLTEEAIETSGEIKDYDLTIKYCACDFDGNPIIKKRK